MIQDLDVSFDNQYSHRRPIEESRIVFSTRGLLWVLEKADQEENNEYNESQNGWNDHQIEKVSMLFPTYEQVKELVKTPTYLFSVDGEGYYWQALEKASLIGNAGTDQARGVEAKSGEEREIVDLVDRLKALADSQEWQGKLVAIQAFRGVEDKKVAMAGMVAGQMIKWYQANKFCGRCAAPLVSDHKERMLRCPSCGNMVYPRINPAVIVAVTDGDQLLLTRYNGRRYKNYALVAGFVEMGESVEQTVEREVMEETGLKVKNIRYYKSQPWGFSDNILMGYTCQVDGSREIKREEEELSVAQWVKREDIKEINQDMSLTNDMICAFKVDKY